jgi:hypothetical protein
MEVSFMKCTTVVIIGLILVLSTPVFTGDIEIAKRYGVKDETPTASKEAAILQAGTFTLPGQLQAIKDLLPGGFMDTPQVRELGPSFVNVENGGGSTAQVKELGPSFVNVENGGGSTVQVKELGPSFINVENGGGGSTARVKE